jgi:glycine cleavage system P protein (glycine dehydrogenase) subunit 2
MLKHSLIFEKLKMSTGPLLLHQKRTFNDCPPALLRSQTPLWPTVGSKLQVVRHYTQLSRKNFSIETEFYPLGSCTMKYNPREVHRMVSLAGFLNHHPLTETSHSQGFMRCAYELQEMLKAITGMQGVSLSPMAGAQGELAGVLMIRAYHKARGDTGRTEILVPDSAHGTNPASAVMCGYTVKELPTAPDGDLELNALKKAVGPQTAGIMLTNPSTLGLFERQIKTIAEIVHSAGGLLYYDGANLNAILGKVRPGDMGFDVMHMNLHKTFATPHGGGGPGAGPIAVNKRLLPYLPVPRVHKQEDKYLWLTEKDCPETIGRLSTFMGNAGIILRAYCYMRLLGRKGLHRVGEYATLNANYLFTRLKQIGFTAAFPNRRSAHEFIISLKPEMKRYHLNAMDFAKRLLDFGIHAPTTYFPLLIPECWLIEPTETESKEELDHFVSVMQQLQQEAETNPELIKTAPHTLPVRRLDDVYAAKVLDLKYVLD